jgi:hypothetical protein
LDFRLMKAGNSDVPKSWEFLATQN